MKHIVCERQFRAKPIRAEMTVTDSGVQVGLFGGDKPHIGAVGIVDPARKVTVTQFEDHREGILCQQWCEAFAKAGYIPAVVSAGVHYDNASKEEIRQVVRLCGELLEEALNNFMLLDSSDDTIAPTIIVPGGFVRYGST